MFTFLLLLLPENIFSSIEFGHITVSSVRPVHVPKANCFSKMENLGKMKEQLDALISEMYNKKRVDNSALFSGKDYNTLINSVKSAK